jgi:chromatin segregation and condensation protein Rec8/ScpA/Scc1 (kleisin family)
MGLRFPPIERFLDRFRATLRRRKAFMLDAELEGLSRLEQAAAFLAVLELRKGNEVKIEQAAPFGPIRVSRLDIERSTEWRTARSA